MRAFCIIPMEGGAPALPEETPVKGYVLGAQHGGFGLYLIAGTKAQMQAVDALPETCGICTTAQIDDIISSVKRAEINAWKNQHFPSLPDVPADWTCGRIVRYVYGRADQNYHHEVLYIKDDEEQGV